MPNKFLPKYYFTGESSCDSDEDYWYIYLKSTGDLTMEWPKKIDVFLVGGGGAGGNGTAAGGGGGGYTTTGKNISIDADTEYRIVVGRGGEGGEVAVPYSNGYDGQPSMAFGLTAAGGEGGKCLSPSAGEQVPSPGGSGGSGGGGGTYKKEADGGFAGAGGSNGSSGGRSDGAAGGSGQGSNTHAFADSRYPLYAGGGGGYSRRGMSYGGEGGGGHGEYQPDSDDEETPAADGTPNTGGGGGGGGESTGLGGAGGSGIVIIRSSIQDYLPVFFGDTRLQEVWYNGVRAESLVFNGQELY